MNADGNFCVDNLETTLEEESETPSRESAAMREPGLAKDIGQASASNPVRVETFPGEVHVELRPGLPDARYAALLDDLRRDAKTREPYRRWQVRASALDRLELPLLDALLRLGKWVRAQGGRITVTGIDSKSVAAPFHALFLDRCREEGIEIVASADAD